MGEETNTKLNYQQKNVGLAHGLIQINGYLRRGLHLERFDPSRRLIEPRIWIYTRFRFQPHLLGFDEAQSSDKKFVVRELF